MNVSDKNSYLAGEQTSHCQSNLSVVGIEVLKGFKGYLHYQLYSTFFADDDILKRISKLSSW